MLTSMRKLAARARTMMGLSLSVAAVACGIHSNRDMSAPPREITYSDACGLQDYFDQRARGGLGEPKAADEMLATNEKGQTIGEGTYVLDVLARRRFGRLLRDEYSGVDPKLIHAVEGSEGRVTVHVRWWDAGQIKRVRPDDDVVVVTQDGVLELPPNICVGDLLFGEKVYAMRARYLRNEVNLETGQPLEAPSSDPAEDAIEARDAGPPAPSTTAPSPAPTMPPPAPSTSAAPSSSAAPSIGTAK